MHSNEHVKHPNELLPERSISDRIAKTIEPMFGTMRAFWFLVAWMAGWIILATVGIGVFRHDRYPFNFLLFLSNLYQLWALPVLGYLAKKGDKKRDAKAAADHEALTHIANQLDELVNDQQFSKITDERLINGY